MDHEEHKVLFELLDSLLDDTWIHFGGGEFEHFNSNENINNLIDQINKKFSLKLRD